MEWLPAQYNESRIRWEILHYLLQIQFYLTYIQIQFVLAYSKTRMEQRGISPILPSLLTHYTLYRLNIRCESLKDISVRSTGLQLLPSLPNGCTPWSRRIKGIQTMRRMQRKHTCLLFVETGLWSNRWVRKRAKHHHQQLRAQ